MLKNQEGVLVRQSKTKGWINSWKHTSSSASTYSIFNSMSEVITDQHYFLESVFPLVWLCNLVIIHIHHLFCTHRRKTIEGSRIVSSLRQEEKEDTLETFQNGFCDIDAKPNSNGFITEYVLPKPAKCSLRRWITNVFFFFHYLQYWFLWSSMIMMMH